MFKTTGNAAFKTGLALRDCCIPSTKPSALTLGFELAFKVLRLPLADRRTS